MSQHKDHFTPRMFHRLLAPSLAYSLGLAFAAMADAIVIGWQMGATGLAALCFSLPLHTMLLAFVHGLGLGGSTRYARLLAEGKCAQATDCFNRVLQAGLAISVLLAALVNLFPQAILELLGTTPADGTLYTAAKGYLCLIAAGAPLFLLKYMLNDFLRSDDNRRLATRGSLYGNAIRIALDLVFVPGLGMGTAGAAGAALIGLSVSVLYYMPALFAKDRTLDATAQEHKAVSIISAGWDPGSDSIVRTMLEAIAPKGITYTNFGPGMSMGHTVAVKAIDGVKAALSMTIPTGTGIHRRMVYIELKDGYKFEEVAAAIKADPYFVNDETHVKLVPSVDALLDMGHGVNLTRKGVSGKTQNQLFEFNMRINNPALTAQVLVCVARASMKQQPGCYTMVEVPVIDLLPGDREEWIGHLV